MHFNVVRIYKYKDAKELIPMLLPSVIKCFGPTEAKMWHVAFSSLAAKQQPANRYVVSKPSNYKWYMHTHICRREQEINTKP